MIIFIAAYLLILFSSKSISGLVCKWWKMLMSVLFKDKDDSLTCLIFSITQWYFVFCHRGHTKKVLTFKKQESENKKIPKNQINYSIANAK